MKAMIATFLFMGMLQATTPAFPNEFKLLDCTRGECDLDEYYASWTVADSRKVTMCNRLTYTIQPMAKYDMDLPLQTLQSFQRRPIYFQLLAFTEQCDTKRATTFTASPNFERTINLHYRVNCQSPQRNSDYFQFEYMWTKNEIVVGGVVKQPFCQTFPNQPVGFRGTNSLWVKYNTRNPNAPFVTPGEKKFMMNVAAGVIQIPKPAPVVHALPLLNCRKGECDFKDYYGLWKATIVRPDLVTSSCKTLRYSIQPANQYSMNIPLQTLQKYGKDPIYYQSLAFTEKCDDQKTITRPASPTFTTKSNFLYFVDFHPWIKGEHFQVFQIERIFKRNGEVIAAVVKQPLVSDFVNKQGSYEFNYVQTLWARYNPASRDADPLTPSERAILMQIAKNGFDNKEL